MKKKIKTTKRFVITALKSCYIRSISGTTTNILPYIGNAANRAIVWPKIVYNMILEPTFYDLPINNLQRKVYLSTS